MAVTKPEQILQIDPSFELNFQGPFTEVVTSYLKLTNPSERQVCFKVKTTAPKQYCVRPNSGFIPAKGQVNVAVMLQPFDINSEKDRGKHKFMVQSAYVPEGESSLDNIWKNTSPNDLMDSKLKVNFNIPDTSRIVDPTAQPAPKAGPTSAITDADYRRVVDENKRIGAQLQQLESDNHALKIHRLETQGGRTVSFSPGGSPQDVKMWQVIVVGIVAMILGLLFGRIF